jgi:thiamine-phosphate pyrophosphorylase
VTPAGQRTRSAISGLYAITPDTPDTPALLSKVAAAIEGGARFVQYRNKAASRELRIEQARALNALCRERGAALIVNDHLDIARLVGAAGLHLGGDDGSAAAARDALGPDTLLGISCYDSLERAGAAAAHADYVAFGSFFPSSVKPDAVHAPLDLLRRAREELRVPLVAIGGITPGNAPQLVQAGADAVAVISALFDARDIAEAARRFTRLFEVRDEE